VIVKAIAESFPDAPDDGSWGFTKDSKAFITKDKEYPIYAISVFKGRVSFQILNDLDMVVWLPYRFFTVVDRSMPDDWECNVLHGEVQLILGPSFVSESEDAYTRMVEEELDQKENFWKRLEQQ
jgi:hypothetical protein